MARATPMMTSLKGIPQGKSQWSGPIYQVELMADFSRKHFRPALGENQVRVGRIAFSKR